jgi:NitT/TauT family transport system substrate-binding protein
MRALRQLALIVTAVVMAWPAWAADKVTVAMNWNVPYSGWAGFYVARDKGYFKAQNLDVEFLLLKGSNPANQATAAGSAQLVISTASSITVAASKGLPLVAVSAYMQNNPEGVIARKDRNIVELKDFVGKRIGYSVDNPSIYMFEAKLARAGIDRSKMTWVSVQSEALVPLLLKGEVDASMGYWDWEAINAEKQGQPVNVFVMSDDKVQIYGPVVSANTAWAKNNGDMIRRFLFASVQGWVDAAADLDKTLQVMLAANPEEDKVFMRQALEVSMKLIGSPRVAAKGFGWMEAADWQGLQDALLKGKVIEKAVDVSKLYTNEYQPANAKAWTRN